jgi:hypothetical protein
LDVRYLPVFTLVNNADADLYVKRCVTLVDV